MRTNRSLSATANRVFSSARRSHAADRGWFATSDRHAGRVSVEMALITAIRQNDR